MIIKNESEDAKNLKFPGKGVGAAKKIAKLEL